MMISQLFLASFVMGIAGAASDGGPQFRVRRRDHNSMRHLRADDDFFLTFSDEGKSKTLYPFILEMYETPSQLQDDAIPILRMAMNKFLLAELNGIYASGDNELESVGSEVYEYASLTRPGGRSLEEIGTEAEMDVTLTFDSEPSPAHKELEEQIRIIMSNLTYFISNLTSFQHSDWADVTEAYRREMPTPSPTASPVDKTDGIEGGGDGNQGKDDNSKNSAVGAIVPTTVIAASLIAMVVFLFVQRRSRRGAESPKNRESILASVENDLYSIDRSLESSRSPQLGMRSPAGVSSIDYSTSVDESVPEDSVFSGIDYTPSNYSNVKGTKSLLSGFTNASAATIRASNMDHQESQRLQSMAARGSLYAFDEATYDEENEEDSAVSNVLDPAHQNGHHQEHQDTHLEHHNAHQEASPSLRGTDIEEPETKSFLPACYGNQPAVGPGTSGHVLADLESLANSRGQVSRDPTPTAAATTGSVYSNLFSCRPTLPKEPEANEAMDNELDLLVRSAKTPTGITGHSMFACGPTPLTRNTATTPGSGTSQISAKSDTVGTMSGKATRLIGGALAEDLDSLHNRSRALSADGLRHNPRPPKSGSKSAPTTPEKNRNNAKALKTYRSMPMDEEDYVKNLSRPSTPGGELADSLNMAEFENTGYGCYPFGMSRTAPAGLGDKYHKNGRHHAGNTNIDGTAMYQTSAMNALDAANGRRHPGNTATDGTAMYQTSAMNAVDATNGRRHAGNTGLDGTAIYQANAMHDPLDGAHGRRHAGNTGIDGTAMYQESAMHPLEWSYKSADLQSIGDSTLSENDESAMPRQFLFGGKRDKRSTTSTSPGREPKTPVSQRSGKSATSARTNESSQGSASRQLINDLVWLERKIADVRQGSLGNGPPGVATVDSLSYVSDDNAGFDSVSSRDESEDEPTVSTGRNESVMSSIICRDCYAPPGKLHIVIHSTKDGPAVHSVKQGSSLEGHIFPGDLIISVDNIDTRSYTAEQVMKMMASRSNQERKITVLHFEEED